MPEGAEAAVISNQLYELLVGKTLINIKCDQRSKYSENGIPGFNHLKFPYICSKVYNKGKKIIILLDTVGLGVGLGDKGKEKETVCILVGLGMSGRFLTEPTDHSNIWLEFGKWIIPKKIKVPIRICTSKIYFDDSRHFGNFNIYPNVESMENALKKTTGPDLLNDDVTLEEWTKKLKNGRLSKKEICLFLLDQKQFSGIGNYLRAEILYASGVGPYRTLGSLSDDEIKTLLKISKQKLRESYESGGLTIRDYLAPDGSRGNFQQVVYAKETDPLGNKVIKEKDKLGRMIHWVPSVQK